MKSNRKKLLISGLILILVSIISVIAYLGVAQDVFYMDTKGSLDSDYVFKVGMNSGTFADLIEIEKSQQSSTAIQIDSINYAIDNMYALAIFDTPMKINPNMGKRLAKQMTDYNKELKTASKYMTKEQKKVFDKAFSKGVFTQGMINSVRKPNPNYYSVTNLMKESEKSLNNWCNGINSLYKSGLFVSDFESADQEFDMWFQICNGRKGALFVKEDSNAYRLNLPDITIKSVEYKGKQSTCNPYTYCYEYDGKKECSTTEICDISYTDRQIIERTIKFSKLDIRIKNLNGDIAIGVNSKGISELGLITKSLNFEDYANKIDLSCFAYNPNYADYSSGDWMNDDNFCIGMTNSKGFANKENEGQLWWESFKREIK